MKTFPLLTRRDFLRTSTVGAAAVAAGLPTIIPSSALGADGAVAPSNRLAVGGIGLGPQGMGVMSNFLGQKDCQVVAVCDLKEDQLGAARKQVNDRYQNQDCKTYGDFRELVARPDIDACLIATPDHWHILTALAAVNAGKDIYLEKPLALTLAEGLALRRAVQDKKRIFQFGTQQRSGRMFWLACELVRNGLIGKLQHINVWAPGSTPGGSTKEAPVPAGLNYDSWLGPAPFKPYTENRCSADGGKKTWWFINDYTLGFLSGWGVHPLDIALWGAGDLASGIVEVEGHGNFPTEGACNTATVWEVGMKFGSGVTMTFVGLPNGGNAGQATGQPAYHFDEWRSRYRRIESHGTAFEGTDGWVHIDRSGINVSKETLLDTPESAFTTKLIKSGNHVRNFLDSIKSRQPTVCPVEDAVKVDTLCHVSDAATRLKRRVKFDSAKEQFIGDDEANRGLQARPMRAPWKLG